MMVSFRESDLQDTQTANLHIFTILFGIVIQFTYASSVDCGYSVGGPLNRDCPHMVKDDRLFICLSMNKNCQKPDEYHCAKNIFGVWTEVCARQKMCEIGEEPYVTEEENVDCRLCADTERYNPTATLSNKFSYCPRKKTKCSPFRHGRSRIECEDFNDNDKYTKDRRCRCNYEDNFIPRVYNFESYNLTCTSYPENPDCYPSPCTSYPENLDCYPSPCENMPDGRKQKMGQDYRCHPVSSDVYLQSTPASSFTGITNKPIETTHAPSTVKLETTSPLLTKKRTTAREEPYNQNKNEPEYNNYGVGIIIVFTVGAFLVAVISLVLLIGWLIKKYHKVNYNRTTNITNIDGDNFNISGNLNQLLNEEETGNDPGEDHSVKEEESEPFIHHPSTPNLSNDNSVLPDVESKPKAIYNHTTEFNERSDLCKHGSLETDTQSLSPRYIQSETCDRPQGASKSPKSPKGSKSEESKSREKKDKRLDVEITVSYFVSPSEFHIQLASAGKDGLDDLMKNMAESYKDSEVTWVSWTKGSHCAAKAEDGKWYRARISNVIHKNVIEVLMLDFGFKETLSASSLRPILKHFQEPRFFSFCCHLADVTPAGGVKTWSRTASEFMEEQIKNNKLFIKRKGNTENNSLPVDLIIEEYIDETAVEPGHRIYHSLINMIKERGLAIPLKRRAGDDSKAEPPKVVNSPVCPVLHYSKVDCKLGTGDLILPVYVDYKPVVHLYTMGGGNNGMEQPQSQSQSQQKPLPEFHINQRYQEPGPEIKSKSQEISQPTSSHPKPSTLPKVEGIYRRVLDKNIQELKNRLPSCTIDSIIKAEIGSESQHIDISDLKGTRDRNEKIVKLIKSQGFEGYKKFKVILWETNQISLLKKLEETEKELLKEGKNIFDNDHTCHKV